MKKLTAILLFAAASCLAQPFAFTNLWMGTGTNTGTGDNLHTAGPKINNNFYFITNLLARMDFGQGTTETDGTFTNSFRWTYSNPPTVIACQVGGNLSTTNAVTNVTTTNFVYRATKAGVVHNWFSIERIP